MNNFFNVLLIFALITESGNFQNKRKEQILKNIIAVIRDVRVEMQQFIEQFFRPFLTATANSNMAFKAFVLQSKLFPTAST